jgi:hypothetical protein
MVLLKFRPPDENSAPDKFRHHLPKMAVMFFISLKKLAKERVFF